MHIYSFLTFVFVKKNFLGILEFVYQHKQSKSIKRETVYEVDNNETLLFNIRKWNTNTHQEFSRRDTMISALRL